MNGTTSHVHSSDGPVEDKEDANHTFTVISQFCLAVYLELCRTTSIVCLVVDLPARQSKCSAAAVVARQYSGRVLLLSVLHRARCGPLHIWVVPGHFVSPRSYLAVRSPPGCSVFPCRPTRVRRSPAVPHCCLPSCL